MNDTNSTVQVNGQKKNTYYADIAGVCLPPNPASRSVARNLVNMTNEYLIHSPRGSKNAYAFKALRELSKQLVNLEDTFAPEDFINFSLKEFLGKFGGSSNANPIRKRLMKDHTAGIIPVTNKIKTFNLDPTTQLILSNEPVYQYLLYRVIEGLGVDKSEGIISGLMDSVPKVQQYINGVIVEQVLEARNLEYTPADLMAIQEKAQAVYLDYTSSEIENQIVDLYNQRISGGSIIDQIEAFLDSKVVDIPLGTDRAELVNKMLKYLQKVGYNPTAEEVVSAPSPSTPKDGSIINALPILFTWLEVADTSHYEWQMAKSDNWDKDNGFDRADLWKETMTLGPSFLSNDHHLPDGRYFWSVRAVSLNGNKSAFSPLMAINAATSGNTNTGPPATVAAPKLWEPDDEQTVYSQYVKFMWDSISNSKYYHIQIATVKDWHKDFGFDPDDMVYQKFVKNASYTLNLNTLDTEVYYWTVQVVLEDGTRSDFSEIRMFKLDVAANQVKDNLKIIEGIGDIIETFLHDNGITSFNQIANMTEAELDALLEKEDTLKGRDTSTWRYQADLAAKGKIDKLEEWKKNN